MRAGVAARAEPGAVPGVAERVPEPRRVRGDRTQLPSGDAGAGRRQGATTGSLPAMRGPSSTSTVTTARKPGWLTMRRGSDGGRAPSDSDSSATVPVSVVGAASRGAPLGRHRVLDAVQGGAGCHSGCDEEGAGGRRDRAVSSAGPASARRGSTTGCRRAVASPSSRLAARGRFARSRKIAAPNAESAIQNDEEGAAASGEHRARADVASRASGPPVGRDGTRPTVPLVGAPALPLACARLTKDGLGHDDDAVPGELGAPAESRDRPRRARTIGVEAAEVVVDGTPHEHAARAHGEDVRALVVLALVGLAADGRGEPATGARDLDAHLDEPPWVVPVDDLGPGDTTDGTSDRRARPASS